MKGKDTLALFPTIEHIALDGKGTVIRQTVARKTHDLAVRKEVRYCLTRVPSSVIHELTQCPIESLFLSISTFGKEIHRFGGDEIHQILEKVEETYKAIEEKEKPKVTIVNFYTGNSPILTEVGTLKVHATRQPDGSLATRIEPVSLGFSLSYEEGERLIQQVISNHALGRIGKYEWRIG
jgi:hypothetical protein